MGKRSVFTSGFENSQYSPLPELKLPLISDPPNSPVPEPEHPPIPEHKISPTIIWLCLKFHQFPTLEIATLENSTPLETLYKACFLLCSLLFLAWAEAATLLCPSSLIGDFLFSMTLWHSLFSDWQDTFPFRAVTSPLGKLFPSDL